MYVRSKSTSLLILAVTSILCSKALFFFFNDPEGPNLLIVLVAAAVIFFLSVAAYLSKLVVFTGLKRVGVAIFIQITLTIILYFLMNI